MLLDRSNQCFGVSGTNIFVDVQAIGRATNRNDVSTQFV
jgi:hypothetical protein